jgi:hypothetical protein
MRTSDAKLEVLVERIEKLERQNRFWRLGGLLAALLIALSLAAGVRAHQERPTIEPVPKSIKAQAFIVTDDDGTTRGALTVKNGVPLLELYNADGKVTWSTRARIVTQGQ